MRDLRGAMPNGKRQQSWHERWIQTIDILATSVYPARARRISSSMHSPGDPPYFPTLTHIRIAAMRTRQDSSKDRMETLSAGLIRHVDRGRLWCAPRPAPGVTGRIALFGRLGPGVTPRLRIWSDANENVASGEAPDGRA